MPEAHHYNTTHAHCAKNDRFSLHGYLRIRLCEELVQKCRVASGLVLEGARPRSPGRDKLGDLRGALKTRVPGKFGHSLIHASQKNDEQVNMCHEANP